MASTSRVQSAARSSRGGALEAGLTIRELLEESDLGFRLLTGDVGLDRLVAGVHHSDLPDPAPWMAEGTLLVTHGAPFAASPSDGIDYLDRLAEKTAGLVIAVGPLIDGVRREHIDHAISLRMPLLEVQKTVPIRTIFSYVYHALASRDMHQLRRALAVHGQLLDLLIEKRSIGEVLSQLGAILDMGLVLFDATGKVLATAGPSILIDTDLIWQTCQNAGQDWGPLGILEAEHGRVRLFRVSVHGSVEAILAAVATSASDELGDMALSYAQRLIALDVIGQRESTAHRRRVRSLLLLDYLAREDDAHAFLGRLLAHDIDVWKQWRVVAVRSCDPAGSQPAAQRIAGTPQSALDLAAEIESSFVAHGVPCISAVQKNAVVALVVLDELAHDQTKPVVDAVLDHVERTHPQRGLKAGVSSHRVGPICPAAALRQAFESLESAAGGVGSADRVVVFDQVSGSYHLLDGQSVEALIAMQDRIVAPLEEYDRRHSTALVATLRAFLDHRMSMHCTAETLFVHRNTLHKRLQRIEQLLHVSLQNMDDLMEIYLALRASDLLRSPRSGAL